MNQTSAGHKANWTDKSRIKQKEYSTFISSVTVSTSRQTKDGELN